MNNSITKLLNKQPFFKKVSHDDFSLVIENLSEKEAKCLDYLLLLANKYFLVAPSQTTVGRCIGVGRQYTNRLIKSLCYAGLIDKKQRYNKSCIYSISDHFWNPHIRSQYAHIFSSLRGVPFYLLTSRFGKQATLYKERIRIYIKKGLKNNIWGRVKKHLYQGTGIMSKIANKIFGSGNPISPQIRNLEKLNLTKWGQIKLSCFPDEAISSAYASFCATKDIKNPFGWFYMTCLYYCQANKIIPDWNYSRQLEEHYRMPSDARMTLSAEKGKVENPSNKPHVDQPVAKKHIDVSPRDKSLSKGLHDNFNYWHKMFPTPDCILQNDEDIK